MEERIIEASFTKNKLCRIVFLISIAIIVLGIIIGNNDYRTGGRYLFQEDMPYTEIYDSLADFLFDRIVSFRLTLYTVCIYLGLVGIIAAAILTWQMGKCSLTVTNRQVVGKASFGKSVVLPINQISAVGLGCCGRITIATSSGKIHFWLLENRDAVHSQLAKIINEVQIEKAYQANTTTQSNADELKKFKELLDSGVITQEEFDAKKKQLLGL